MWETYSSRYLDIAGLKADVDRASPTLISSDVPAPRAKRQKVEVVLDSSTRTIASSSHRTRVTRLKAESPLSRLPAPSTSTYPKPESASSSSTTRTPSPDPPTSSSTRKRNLSVAEGSADPVPARAEVENRARVPFDMKKWKEELRKLYSADCTLPEDDIRSRLHSLFARLPDEQTRKTAFGYVAALGDVVQEGAQAHYDRARGPRDEADVKLKNVRVELAQAQNKVDAAEQNFHQLERDSDASEVKLMRVKTISTMIDALVGATTHDSDVGLDSRPTSPSASQRDAQENGVGST